MKVFSTSAAAGPRATTGPNECRYDTVQTRTSKLRFEFNVTGEAQAKKPIIGRVHMVSLLSKMQRDETIVSVLPIKIDDTTNPAVDNLTSLPQDDNIYKYFDIKNETVKQGNRDNLIVKCRLLCSKTIPQLKFDSGPLYGWNWAPGEHSREPKQTHQHGPLLFHDQRGEYDPKGKRDHIVKSRSLHI